jgi:hypothetical protein
MSLHTFLLYCYSCGIDCLLLKFGSYVNKEVSDIFNFSAVYIFNIVVLMLYIIDKSILNISVTCTLVNYNENIIKVNLINFIVFFDACS